MRTRNDVYVMMDVEASGTRLGHHDLIQFGAVAAWGTNLEHQLAFPAHKPKPDVPANLVVPHFRGDPDPAALKVTGLRWDDVLAYGEAPAAFVDRFYGWVGLLKQASGAEKVILTGHGVTFDWAMTKLLYDAYRGDWPCHYSGLDFKSWYGGRCNLEYIDSSMTEMQKEFGLRPNKHKHDAQADADHQFKLMLLAFRASGFVANSVTP